MPERRDANALMDAQRYEEAAQAYGASLARRPNDARTLVRRGYAWLHVDTEAAYASARADFEAAIAATDDARLRAMAHYNLGLLEDRLGNGNAAIVRYRQSLELRPTEAARRRAAGERECAVEVQLPVELRTFDSWRAAFDGLLADEDAQRSIDRPASEDDARTLVCGEQCGGVELSRPFGDDYYDFAILAFAVPGPRGSPRIVGPISDAWRECSGSPELDGSTDEIAGRIHVHGTLIAFHGECECDPEDADCMHGAWFARRDDAHLVYDRARDRAYLARVSWTQPDNASILNDVDGERAGPLPYLRVDVTVDDDALEVRGCGVHARRSFAE